MYLWAAVASYSVAAMAFFPLRWVLPGAGIALVFTVLMTVDLMPGLRQAWRRRMTTRRIRPKDLS